MFAKSVTFFLALSITGTGLAAENVQDKNHRTPTATEMVVDGLVHRPLSLAGTVAGTGLFLITLPFSLIGGNADEAGQRLVVEPASSTFNRCLGCLPDYDRLEE